MLCRIAYLPASRTDDLVPITHSERYRLGVEVLLDALVCNLNERADGD
jgi:hypothetical protein